MFRRKKYFYSKSEFTSRTSALIHVTSSLFCHYQYTKDVISYDGHRHISQKRASDQWNLRLCEVWSCHHRPRSQKLSDKDKWQQRERVFSFCMVFCQSKQFNLNCVKISTTAESRGAIRKAGINQNIIRLNIYVTFLKFD